MEDPLVVRFGGQSDPSLAKKSGNLHHFSMSSNSDAVNHQRDSQWSERTFTIQDWFRFGSHQLDVQ